MRCDKCGLSFSSKIRLERHKNKAHPNKRIFHKGKYWVDDIGAGVI